MAARLSELLAVVSGSPTTTAHLTLSELQADNKALVAALAASWNRFPSLQGLAIHRSMSGNGLLVHCEWGGSMQEAARDTEAYVEGLRDVDPDCHIEQHLLTLNTLRRGRAPGSGEFLLEIKSFSDRPVLVAAFEPVHRGPLLEYLHQAGARFAQEVEGWRGAALYCDTDGRRVVEYLQFESMEGVAESQGSPLVQQHQLALQKFGSMKADLYQVRDVFCRRAN
jgi:hypothetical protein